MLTYFLIGLSLSLFGLAGTQFFYLNYLERIDRSRKKHIRALEQNCRNLTVRLDKAETRIAEQAGLLEPYLTEEETWAEIIEAG